MRWAWLTLLGGCDRLLGFEHVPSTAPVDALACSESLTPGDYSAVTPLFTNAKSPSLSSDQRLIYAVTDGIASYATFATAWSPLAAVPTLADPMYYVDWPSLSYDGQAIVINRHVAGGGFDLPYQATKDASGTESWGTPSAVAFPAFLAGNDVVLGVPSADGTRVVATHGDPGHNHLAELVRSNGAWSLIDTMAALYPVGGDVSDSNAQLAPDACWMVFERIDRAVDINDHDIWLALRGSDGLFLPPQRLFTGSSTHNEQHPWLSPDASALYFFDGTTIYLAQRTP